MKPLPTGCFKISVPLSAMTIERTSREVIFRLPADTDISSLQRILNYLRYREAIKESQATEEQAQVLANDSKNKWWSENKGRFIR